MFSCSVVEQENIPVCVLHRKIIQTPIISTVHCVLEKPSQSRCKWFVAQEKKILWVFSQALGGIMTPLTIIKSLSPLTPDFSLYLSHTDRISMRLHNISVQKVGLHLWFVLQRRSGATVTLSSISNPEKRCLGWIRLHTSSNVVVTILTCNICHVRILFFVRLPPCLCVNLFYSTNLTTFECVPMMSLSKSSRWWWLWRPVSLFSLSRATQNWAPISSSSWVPMWRPWKGQVHAHWIHWELRKMKLFLSLTCT